MVETNNNDKNNSFERRVSISHSGRWKQKNRQRSSIQTPSFLMPTCEMPPNKALQESPAASQNQNWKSINV